MQTREETKTGGDRTQAATIKELVMALEYAAKLIPTARQYFPKSIRNRDRFDLENTCATIGKAIFNAKEVI